MAYSLDMPRVGLAGAKIIIVALLVVFCAGLTHYFHFRLGTEVGFTHVFYVPVVLAGIWWGRRAVWVALFLGGWLIGTHLAVGTSYTPLTDIFRAVMIVVVSLVVGWLTEARWRSKRLLTEARDFLDGVVSRSGNPLLVWDRQGLVIMFNPALEELTGFQAENMTGKPVASLFPEEDLARIREALEGDFVKAIESPIRCHEGGQAVCLWSAANLLSADGRTVIASMVQGQDITKRKWAEDVIKRHAQELEALNARLARSESRLRELNAAKDKFFSIISHDLRSPFMPLLIHAEMMWKEGRAMDIGKIEESSQAIYNNAKRLFSLVENLLDWARIQTGRMEFCPEPVGLREVVNQNLVLLRENAEVKKISLVNEVVDDVTVFADKYHLNCIIQNLVANAIKFTQPGGEVRVRGRLLDGTAEVTVADNGVGIAPENIASLFRIDCYHTTVGTAREKGSGLGLILCKEMVEKNGGGIRVESEPDRGSAFSFTLPRRGPSAAARPTT